MVDANPYVGPRPFGREDRHRFFGRDREASELLSLIIAHRCTLLYARSGAGKSSLLNALVTPLLVEEGFEVMPTARVHGPLPNADWDQRVDNVYLIHTLLSLNADETHVDLDKAGRLTELSLGDFLTARPHKQDDFEYPLPRVIIFDQFEELFTAYPQHWKERETFFQQLNATLETDPILHVVFSMREDYLAQLDSYADMLPFNLRARFRLERMRPRAALEAVRGPLANTKRSFAPGVAEQLVEDLRRVRIESHGGETATITGEFVEPVQLQVVCQSLWEDLPSTVDTITSEHLRTFGHVDQALAAFYERAVGQAVPISDVGEQRLRAWFEKELLTPTGTRSTVHRGPEETAGIANAAVDLLEDQHLLRGEWRAGARWYELTHDRLIDPIRDSNRRWTELQRERHGRTIRRRFAIIGIAALLLVSVLVWSLRARATAQAEAEMASERSSGTSARQFAAQSLALQERQLDLSLLLAVEATSLVETWDTRNSLLAALQAEPSLSSFLHGHDNGVTSVVFSPDGETLASGSTDGTIILWHVATRQRLGEPFAVDGGTVSSAVFSPDGEILASGSTAGTIASGM